MKPKRIILSVICFVALIPLIASCSDDDSVKGNPGGDDTSTKSPFGSIFYVDGERWNDDVMFGTVIGMNVNLDHVSDKDYRLRITPRDDIEFSDIPGLDCSESIPMAGYLPGMDVFEIDLDFVRAGNGGDDYFGYGYFNDHWIAYEEYYGKFMYFGKMSSIRLYKYVDNPNFGIKRALRFNLDLGSRYTGKLRYGFHYSKEWRPRRYVRGERPMTTDSSPFHIEWKTKGMEDASFSASEFLQILLNTPMLDASDYRLADVAMPDLPTYSSPFWSVGDIFINGIMRFDNGFYATIEGPDGVKMDSHGICLVPESDQLVRCYANPLNIVTSYRMKDEVGKFLSLTLPNEGKKLVYSFIKFAEPYINSGFPLAYEMEFAEEPYEGEGYDSSWDGNILVETEGKKFELYLQEPFSVAFVKEVLLYMLENPENRKYLMESLKSDPSTADYAIEIGNYLNRLPSLLDATESLEFGLSFEGGYGGLVFGRP